MVCPASGFSEMGNSRCTPEGFKLLKAPTKQQKEIYATFGHDLLEDAKTLQ